MGCPPRYLSIAAGAAQGRSGGVTSYLSLSGDLGATRRLNEFHSNSATRSVIIDSLIADWVTELEQWNEKGGFA